MQPLPASQHGSLLCKTWVRAGRQWQADCCGPAAAVVGKAREELRTRVWPTAAAPKPVWRDSAAEIAAARWPSLSSAAARTAAMRCRQRLAAVCSAVAALLRWLFRHRMKAGENTAGTCSDLCHASRHTSVLCMPAAQCSLHWAAGRTQAKSGNLHANFENSCNTGAQLHTSSHL